jgi:hypothetical protein
MPEEKKKKRKSLNVLIDADVLKITSAYIEALEIDRGEAIEQALGDWLARNKTAALKALGVVQGG